MNVAVFGLGYVGAVCAAALSGRGHSVVGVDVNTTKVKLLQEGTSPVLEPGVSELVAQTVKAGSLRATVEAEAAVRDSELSLICVGTPSAANGSLDTEALERVTRTIGAALRKSPHRHTVVVRSTILPGTTQDLVLPILEEASGKHAGADFGLSMNPEFLREGSSLADFDNPAKTVIGEFDEASGDVVERLYEGMPGEVFRVPLAVAEMAKYVDNAFHALKVGFANEVGRTASALGLDSHEVMKIFLSDTKLNISTAYLMPGFAFGGSCLPKDLRALLYAARQADADLPILENVLTSNERHVRKAVEQVLATGSRRVGLLGLSFKPGTDDLRESPLVELAEQLLGKGIDLRIYDPAISLSRLVGANKEFIEDHIPHLSALLVETLEEILAHADVCVVGAAALDVSTALASSDGLVIVDLARLPNAAERRGDTNYISVAW